ncbi:Rieske 2Fe-2S domain-containing protein [Actinomadura madurae]|uniref:Rieske 2Fe-2S domain-containing protein n=1 Tax=Actinomadura madurae TaxID=1993 RepID=UPI003558056D
MIPNQWYAILRSEDVGTRRPTGARRMGRELVLWRDTAGRLICQSARCPHKGANMADGPAARRHPRLPLPRLPVRRRRAVHPRALPRHGRPDPEVDAARHLPRPRGQRPHLALVRRRPRGAARGAGPARGGGARRRPRDERLAAARPLHPLHREPAGLLPRARRAPGPLVQRPGLRRLERHPEEARPRRAPPLPRDDDGPGQPPGGGRDDAAAHVPAGGEGDPTNVAPMSVTFTFPGMVHIHTEPFDVTIWMTPVDDENTQVLFRWYEDKHLAPVLRARSLRRILPKLALFAQKRVQEVQDMNIVTRIEPRVTGRGVNRFVAVDELNAKYVVMRDHLRKEAGLPDLEPAALDGASAEDAAKV